MKNDEPSQRGNGVSGHVDDLRLLKQARARLARCPELSSGLHALLEAALEALGANKGLLSLFFVEEQELRVGASAGFEKAFLKMVTRVPLGGGACGTCLQQRSRVVVVDTEVDPVFEAYREAARAGGFRGCHSVPLLSREGPILGVLTILYSQVHQPDQREEHLLDLYGQMAADFIERMQAEADDRNIGELPEQNSAAVIRVTAKGIIMYANWNSKPLLAHWKIGLGEGVPAHLRGWIAEVFQEGQGRQIEENCGPKTFALTAAPFPELSYVTLYAFDVTARKQAETALRKSQEQLRLFVEQAPAALAMFDQEMRYLAASARWIAAYDLPQDLVGRLHYELFPDLPEKWKIAHRRALAGEVICQDEDSFPRADGTVVWEKWEVRPWTDSSGEVGGVLLYTEDLSKRKRTERALQGRERELELIFRNISDVIFYLAVEPEGLYRFVAINDAFLSATGLQRTQVVGKTVQEVIPEPSCSMVLGQYRLAIQARKTVRWEETSDYPSGRKTGEVSVTPLFTEEGNCEYLIGTVRDLSVRQ